MMKRLAKSGHILHFCYEAGCCGYVLHRQIVTADHLCTVVAPQHGPTQTRRTCEDRSPRCYQAGTAAKGGGTRHCMGSRCAHKAMRDLVRTINDGSQEGWPCLGLRGRQGGHLPHDSLGDREQRSRDSIAHIKRRAIKRALCCTSLTPISRL